MTKRTTNTNLFSFRNIQRPDVLVVLSTLDAFTYFDRMKSQKLLLQLGKTNVSVSGDTDWSCSHNFREKWFRLYFAIQNNSLTIVVGSSWQRTKLLLDFINSNTLNVKFIIALHNKTVQIEQLK
jgi:3-deoxy-D-manno-octulosonic-acid transferase